MNKAGQVSNEVFCITWEKNGGDSVIVGAAMQRNPASIRLRAQKLIKLGYPIVAPQSNKPGRKIMTPEQRAADIARISALLSEVK